jgi:hypothetical protein
LPVAGHRPQSSNSTPAVLSFPRNNYLRLTCLLLISLLVAAIFIEHPRKVDQHIAERKAAGRSVPTHWYVHAEGWRGITVNVALAALLVALTPWAGRKLRETGEDEPNHATAQRQPSGWMQHAPMIMATVCAAIFAGTTYQRLSHSLWGDEEYTMKRLIAPDVERGDDGALKFKETPWTTTLWSFRKTTNHIGYTAVARLFHDTFFKPGTGAKDGWFSEFWIRFPAWLAGIISVFAITWAAMRWHCALAIGLPLFWIMHPWVFRFGSDARGYGFVLLLVPLLFGLVERATATGRWRWWLGYALAQFYLLWTYTGSIYLVATLNLAALGMIATDRRRAGERLLMTSRWVVANLLSMMLLIGLMAPCVPQLLEFLESKPLSGTLDARWFQDTFSALLTGLPWHAWDASNPLCHTLSQVYEETPLALSVILTLLVISLLLGVVSLAMRPRARWLLVAILGAPALMITHMMLTGVRPYDWYFVPFLPGVFILLAAAPDAFSKLVLKTNGISKMRHSFILIWIITAFSLCELASLVQARQLVLLIQNPVEPCRESVALTREITNPRHPDYDKDVITGGFSFYTEGYDPGMVRFQTAEELRSLMTRADAEKKKLFINFGFPAFTREHNVDIFKLLDDPALFRRKAQLHGLFFTATREVYEYQARAR